MLHLSGMCERLFRTLTDREALFAFTICSRARNYCLPGGGRPGGSLADGGVGAVASGFWWKRSGTGLFSLLGPHTALSAAHSSSLNAGLPVGGRLVAAMRSAVGGCVDHMPSWAAMSVGRFFSR